MRMHSSIAGVAMSVVSACAHADIFGYVDEQGDPHFSVEKIDDRYQLFMRGDKAFDSSQSNKPAATAPLSPLMHYLARHPNLQKYELLLNQAAQEFSLEPALLKAVMAAESGFNPLAVSSKGAIGLMQIMPATAERYGLQSDRKKTVEQKLTDPQINIRLGARYLRDLNRMYPKQLNLVLASYNAGEGTVQKYRDQVPPFPETRNYVQLVTQFYQFYLPVSAASTKGRRIHMAIPGRGNMPAGPTTNLE